MLNVLRASVKIWYCYLECYLKTTRNMYHGTARRICFTTHFSFWWFIYLDLYHLLLVLDTKYISLYKWTALFMCMQYTQCNQLKESICCCRKVFNELLRNNLWRKHCHSICNTSFSSKRVKWNNLWWYSVYQKLPKYECRVYYTF